MAFRDAINWTKAGVLLVRPVGTKFSESFHEIHNCRSRKYIWKCHLENDGRFVCTGCMSVRMYNFCTFWLDTPTPYLYYLHIHGYGLYLLCLQQVVPYLIRWYIVLVQTIVGTPFAGRLVCASIRLTNDSNWWSELSSRINKKCTLREF